MFWRKKRKHINGTVTVLISAVVCLNIVGISYAQFSNNIEIANSILTGEMKPVFAENPRLRNEHGEGSLTVKRIHEDIINLEGEVEPGYKADLKYIITDDGSIPFRYDGEDVELLDGLELDLKQEKDLVSNGNSRLRIRAEEPGEYDFRVEVYFKQWNR